MTNSESSLRHFSESERTVGAECPACGRILKISKSKLATAADGYDATQPLVCPCKQSYTHILRSQDSGSDRKASSSTPTHSSATIGCVVLAVIALIVWWAIAGLGPDETNVSQQIDWRNADNSRMAQIMAQEFVSDRLLAPGSAEWPGFQDSRTSVVPLGKQRYRVTSWVDSHNSFGALIRQQYVAVVKQTGPEEWKLKSLEFH